MRFKIRIVKLDKALVIQTSNIDEDEYNDFTDEHENVLIRDDEITSLSDTDGMIVLTVSTSEDVASNIFVQSYICNESRDLTFTRICSALTAYSEYLENQVDFEDEEDNDDEF